MSDKIRDKVYNPAIRPRKARNNAASDKANLTSMYTTILSEMCVNRFEWTGLPETVDVRFMEQILLCDALAIFYFDGEYDRFMALRGFGSGTVNMYDNPTYFTVIGNTMVNKRLSPKECVPIWANSSRIPDMNVIQIYAKRLAEFDTTLEVNMTAMRHPHVISVDTNERLSLVNAYKQVVEGQPVIFGTENFNPASLGEKISLLDLSLPPKTIEEVMQAKTRTWNEALTLLGIMNVNNDKRERMVVEEAAGAAGHVIAMRAVTMNSRERACHEINRMFPGLNVGVRWRLDEGLGGADLERIADNG